MTTSFRAAMPRRGSAYLVVISFAAILAIFLLMMSRVRSGQMALLTKTSKDFMSNTIAEAGLNVALAEINMDSSFRTHYNFNWKRKTWERPVSKRASSIVSIDELKLSGLTKGVYKGETPQGVFKFKIAPIFNSKNNPRTKTVKESESFARAEVVTHIGDGKNAQEDAYRRIVAILDRRSLASEFLLYDGEVLDTGAFGPYEGVPNVLSNGRIYGYQWISFTSQPPNDLGSFLNQVEKIETGGLIRAMQDTRVTWPDNQAFTLSPLTDSVGSKYSMFRGAFLDGNHGAHPFKPTRLPKESLYAKAKRQKNSGGYIIEPSPDLKYSRWKNPYDPKTDYVDLDFGESRLAPDAAPEPQEPGEDGEEPEDEEQTEQDTSAPPPDSDDGGSGHALQKLRGKKLLIYSKLPLRIWGCPDRTVTIFSEQDVVIGGDFNQNPDTPQDYPDANFLNYKTEIKNGRDYHKVGALVMSMGRIFIDHSRPILFAKNEIRPYFMYHLAMKLGPADDVVTEIPKLCFPVEPKKHPEFRGVGSGQSKRFYSIWWVNQMSSSSDGSGGVISTGPALLSKFTDVELFLTCLPDGQPHFGIRNREERDKLILQLIEGCKDGVLNERELDTFYNKVCDVVASEEYLPDPDPMQGAMGLLNPLFDKARDAAKQSPRKEGIYPPEITINASLISSTRRSSPWTIGSAQPKVLEEIGNVETVNPKYVAFMQKPRFIIQRLFGADVRLACAEPTYFVDGQYASKAITRRRYWDKSLAGLPKYRPDALPFYHSILTFRDDSISKKEFDDF